LMFIEKPILVSFGKGELERFSPVILSYIR